MLKTILAIALPLASMAGCAVYDRSETVTEYRTGTVFMTGESAVWAYEHGRVMRDTSGELIGYYGGGYPRFIGFGCDDATGPVIAIEQDALNNCQRVAPVDAAKVQLETR